MIDEQKPRIAITSFLDGYMRALEEFRIEREECDAGK
jgi:hypothetical protein